MLGTSEELKFYQTNGRLFTLSFAMLLALMRSMNHVENFRHLDACHTPLLHLCPSVKVSKCPSVKVSLSTAVFAFFQIFAFFSQITISSIGILLLFSFSSFFWGLSRVSPSCVFCQSQIVTQHCSYVHPQHLQYCLL